MSVQILSETIEIRRASALDPSAIDEWGQPIYGADATVLTGPAGIDPLSMQEVASLSDAGAQIGDFRAITQLIGVRASDRVRRVSTGDVLEVRSVLDFGSHLELLLRKVTA